MSALVRTDHAAGLPVTALPGRFVNLVAGMIRIWMNRREIYRLGEMSDWELADIGLTRADLHVASCVPLGEDPTILLGSVAEARIRAAGAASRKVC